MDSAPFAELVIVLGLIAGCASVPTPPVSCPKQESITLRVFPAPQMNQDREGFARSVVLRVYQLQDERGFRASSFDAIWTAPQSAAKQDEWIVLPGRSVARALPRDPSASHFAVAANFREHRGESGWRALVTLPTPNDSCALTMLKPPMTLDVVLSNYALELR
jgi:type VI secretion system VasD/TssJ family lipoprotein